MRVTERQNALARAFALHGNATRAYLEAGYADVCAANRNAAYRVMQSVAVLRAVEYWRAELSKKIEITEARILAEYAAMAFSDAGAVEDSHGNALPPSQLPAHVRRAIKKYGRRDIRNPEGDVIATEYMLNMFMLYSHFRNASSEIISQETAFFIDAHVV